jgi:hypothetical protein
MLNQMRIIQKSLIPLPLRAVQLCVGVSKSVIRRSTKIGRFLAESPVLVANTVTAETFATMHIYVVAETSKLAGSQSPTMRNGPRRRRGTLNGYAWAASTMIIVH